MITSNESRLKAIWSEYRVFILLLIIGAVIWILVFNAAALNLISGPRIQPHRAVWVGRISFDFFGYDIQFQLEGYIDYDFYYNSWGEQFLSGYLPYTPEFDHIIIDGTPYNTPYFFPPLYVYMCALGRALPIQPFGIGALICIFGYLTAFPIYGIGKYLSNNQRVGEAAAAVYLLNPLVLYHTVFEWFNPAPFVFFTLLSFYFLMQNRRYAGVISIAIAFMFKQTALFLALPVIAVLVKRPPRKHENNIDNDTTNADNDDDSVDIVGFVKLAIVALVTVGLISIPYIFDPMNYLHYIFVKPGTISLTDFSNTPRLGTPMVMAVLFIVAGSPTWLIESINFLQSTSIALIIGILPLFGLMLLERKSDKNLVSYWRRIFYFAFLLVLWLHIWSPRGIYKYYLVLLIPFLSILASSQICSRGEEKIKLSFRMLILPTILTLMVLLPLRIYYLFFLSLIFVGYLFQHYFGATCSLIGDKIRTIRSG